jgi:hypothetical protein
VRLRLVFPQRPTVTNGTVYHVVFKGDFTIGASHVTFGTDTTSPANAGVSSFDGATWAADTTRGLALFAVNVLTGAESITFPTGYTFSGRVSWARTNGSSAIARMTQTGGELTLLTQAETAAPAGTNLWTATDLSTTLPPAWARRYRLGVGPDSGSFIRLARPLPLGPGTIAAGEQSPYSVSVLGASGDTLEVTVPAWVGPMIWTSLNTAGGYVVMGYDVPIGAE